MSRCFVFFASLAFLGSCFADPVELRIERGPIKSYLYPPRKWVSEYNYEIEADWSTRDFITSWEQTKALVKGGKIIRVPHDQSIVALRNSKHLLKKISDGDIIYIHGNAKVNFFIDELIDAIDANIIVIAASDLTIPHQLNQPKKLKKLLKTGKIIHLFGRNIDKRALPQNVTPIPIGIRYITQPSLNREFHLSPASIEKRIDYILKDLTPTTERSVLLMFDCMDDTTDSPVNETGESRREIKKILRESNTCDFAPKRVPWSEYMGLKGERAFDLSPPGAGVDCYRTWESLIMGCIVITKKSFLDPLYEGLPVVLIDDWKEVTIDNLEKWVEEYGDVFNNPAYRERLTHKYWWNKIKKVQDDYRAKR